MKRSSPPSTPDVLPETPASAFRQYRAPREDGTAFWDPALREAPNLLRSNRQALAEHGEFWNELRAQAREQLVADALRYTAAYRDVGWIDDGQRSAILMAGHQPSLFHPGVWFKNFALSRLAETTGSLAINLVIDNDISKSNAVRIPSVDAESRLVRYQTVPYDHGVAGVPYEQTVIKDLSCFRQFDRAVAETVHPLVTEPSVVPLWEHAKAAISRCGIAGCALAQARHGLEGDLGLKTLELPMSVVCRGEPFAKFLVRIFADLERFRDCYNRSAQSYRMAHGIRSSAHPVPDLGLDDGWIEAPMWLFGNTSPSRRSVWARRLGDQLVIGDRRERHVTLDMRDPATAAAQLAAAASPEFKLRPRALLTTMYARLILSDLFLHGIGGGKYDQLGDSIAQTFFGISPPSFMVVSATVLLPGAGGGDAATQVRRIKRELRDSRYRPELFAKLASDGMKPALLKRKRGLLSNIPPSGPDKRWHDEITSINRVLSANLTEHRQQLRKRLAAAQSRLTSEGIFGSREHPFCIYPLEFLSKQFAQLLDGG